MKSATLFREICAVVQVISILWTLSNWQPRRCVSLVSCSPYSLINDLHSGVSTLPEFLSQVEARFVDKEPSIHAFIPEEDPFARLQIEADALLMRYP